MIECEYECQRPMGCLDIHVVERSQIDEIGDADAAVQLE
jgi:hypothetical protein